MTVEGRMQEVGRHRSSEDSRNTPKRLGRARWNRIRVEIKRQEGLVCCLDPKGASREGGRTGI